MKFIIKIILPLIVLVVFLTSPESACAAEEPLPQDDKNPITEQQSTGTAEDSALRYHRDSHFLVLVSPLAGYNRNVMTARGGPQGKQLIELTDTAPIYGLFLLVGHPRFVINDYVFYTEPNDSEVLGNLFYLNIYGDPEATVTWNIGGGHLYHKIKPRHEEIDVKVPMVKAGPLVRIKPWGITINPYLGYTWENIETSRGDLSNESILYGLGLDWRWRMVNLNLKYYYQDSRDDYESYHAARARLVVGLNRHWGVAMRFDYMEQLAGDNTSLMIGPVYVF